MRGSQSFIDFTYKIILIHFECHAAHIDVVEAVALFGSSVAAMLDFYHCFSIVVPWLSYSSVKRDQPWFLPIEFLFF